MSALLDPSSYLFWLLVASAVAFVVERLWPWRKSQRVLRRGLLQDVAWLVFNGHFASLLIALPAAWVASRVDDGVAALGLAPPATMQLLAAAPWWAQLAVVIVVKDLIDWSVHNLLHRVPWLWEFHKLHHSIEELDWIGSFRFHWMEIVVYRCATYLPLAVAGADARVLLASAVVGTFIGHLNHANVALDWGPLRYVLNSPRFHAWHHERLPSTSRGVNYAVVLSAWDWLFGTARYPRGEAPSGVLGFDGDEAFPRSLVGRLSYPASSWLARART